MRTAALGPGPAADQGQVTEQGRERRRHVPVVLAPHTSQSGQDQVGPWASQDTVWAHHLAQVVKSPTEKVPLGVQVLLKLPDT